jgi:hypothetical protein
MCATCHGAPGLERSEIGKGMNPRPPDLADVAAEWTDRELFWITSNGIKLAGMPGFGLTHSDGEIWGIVAFLRRLENMSAAEYRRLANEAGARGGIRGPVHGHAAGPDRPGSAGIPSVEHMHGTGDGRTADAGPEHPAAGAHAAAAETDQAHTADAHAADAHAADAGRPSVGEVPSHVIDGVDHGAAPRRAGVADEHAAHPDQADTGATDN